MKKQFFSVIFILFVFLTNAQQISIETIRKEYHNLHKDSAAAFKLYVWLSKVNPSDNLVIGYKGATTAAMANYAKGKSEKIKLFNSGKKMLEQAMKADSANAELRFLRYTIQTNAPKALGYHTHIEDDKKYILSHYNQIDNAIVKSRISEYFLSSGNLSEEEKKKFKPNGK